MITHMHCRIYMLSARIAFDEEPKKKHTNIEMRENVDEWKMVMRRHMTIEQKRNREKKRKMWYSSTKNGLLGIQIWRSMREKREILCVVVALIWWIWKILYKRFDQRFEEQLYDWLSVMTSDRKSFISLQKWVLSTAVSKLKLISFNSEKWFSKRNNKEIEFFKLLQNETNL